MVQIRNVNKSVRRIFTDFLMADFQPVGFNESALSQNATRQGEQCGGNEFPPTDF